MYNHVSIILVIFAITLNAIVFGYVASNTKNNKINLSYLLFLTCIILYTIFDCVIIQTFHSKESKDIIVKIQAMFWMPLSILFLNFIYLFLRKKKDEIFNFFIVSTIVSLLFTLFSNKVILGFKDFNFGTMAYTGNWFLPIIFLGILPSAFYGLYLISKEAKIFNFIIEYKEQQIEPLLTQQLKILFYGSAVCLIIAVTTNIFFDEVLGYSGELHLASLSLSIQSLFILPALINYNFLNTPMEQLGDELYANSSDAVLITSPMGIILNLNKSAKKMFKIKGRAVNKNIKELFKKEYNYYAINDNFEIQTKHGSDVTVTQTDIIKGKQIAGKILVVRDISSRIEAEKKLLKTTKELSTSQIHLEKSELRLKKAQEIAKLGRWEENHKTGKIYWSPILREMFGLEEKEPIKNNIFWDMVHSEDVQLLKKYWGNAEKEKIPYSGTFRIKLKNGTIKYLNEHADFILDSKGDLLQTIGTVFDTTELHQYQEELRQLSSHIQEVQEKERGHIAREIHDELGQRLTSINMDLSFLKNKLQHNIPKEIEDRLQSLDSLVEETIQMTRKLSQELRPSILDDLGLISAIDWLKEQYNKRSNIHFTLDMPKDEININSEHATAVFRITQEALTNIIRHAEAKNVNIQIKLTNSEIALKVQDDGIGMIENNYSTKEKTYGVFGMKERASSVGGTLVINNNLGKGTVVNLTLPYKAKSMATT